ncbi:LysR family transcriptional regulator [Erwinia sp. OLTSP20]|uniref:LysR substrate-binding domain-containing protein n=1 Tax=unclassified Erwinia TaxID=2622719 RepID=UPI000C17A84D|nr:MULTISPECIES: LysR family transcriptional regulator [unclassified Erwinia]PIJ49894.1 LysR family transcriptional regulator [Erwinia sp. OAMSP11]PIJ71419.1 LysR family transcriptional regulator [Erwinia sp. OLSSP12]PIJ80854.1 LysR family transcriptional regulator [Erwinia sp. OLCASP19]PIJ83333.1 LysR family transcriptional regulator [Erwinia sp. OLMTSP26]PIJ85555.1 LysR family transcriptional regulator [Erwinia sp. OLMDSP33]
MDKFHAMQIFARVAELESFSRAAISLGLAKGNVSRQIQLLEKHIGTRLLLRTTRRVQLTHDGRLYYERCRNLLATVDEMDELFKHDPATLSGQLRVDIPAELACAFVIPALPAFLQHYPGISLELSSNEHRSDVIGEGFDCVLRIGDAEESGLMTRRLGHFRMINLASPGYLARFGTPLSPDDLSQHAMVHYQPVPTSAHQGFEFFDGRQCHYIQTGGVITVNNRLTYHNACLAGLGIIQAPAASFHPALQAKQVVEVMPRFSAQPVPLSLRYPQRRNLSRRTHVFMEWLSQTLKPHLAS